MGQLEAALSPDDYLTSPVGRFVAGRNYLVWCESPAFCGAILWGQFARSESQDCLRVLEGLYHPEKASTDVLFDARRVSSVDAEAFATFQSYARHRLPDLATRIRRQALLRPEGILGSVFAGFYQLVPPPFPVAVFADAQTALEWLGRSSQRALLGELDELQEAAAADSLLPHLKMLLASRYADATLEDCVRALGITRRSLQRVLQQAGTSFRRELNEVRIRVAQDLLERTDTKLTAIAHLLGCSSGQHFSALFRKATGRTPSEWRAGRRAR